MKRLQHRDVEQAYPVAEFVTKLHRLADVLESGRAFNIAVAGERLCIPAAARFNIEHKRARCTDATPVKFKRSSVR